MKRIITPSEEDFPQTADVVVIGGGIVGTATAFWLSKAGLDTVLVEMRSGLSTLTTPNSVECYRKQFTESAMSALARESIDMALSFDKRVENSIGIAKDLFARGMIEEKAGDDEQAYRSYEKSLQVYQAMYLYRSAAAVLPYLISVAERLGRHSEAQRYRELEKQLQGS